MKIEAVTVCVDYADYLEQTLPYTLNHVDDLVVVTSPEDRRTQGLCHKMGVRCLPTRCFYQWGDEFNKGRGINYGLAHLRKSDWVVHLDADIVLPPRTRWLLNVACLEPHKVYGCDRFDVVGREAWDRYRREYDHQYVHSCRMQPPNQFPMSSRLLHVGYGGLCPIGFFQLWNPKASAIDRYPETADDSAEHTDVLHSLQWQKEHRALIPEFCALHLTTKTQAPMGANWRGRTTPEFTLEEKPWRSSGPPIGRRHSNDRDGDRDHRHHHHHDHDRDHHHHHPKPDPYC